MPLKIRITEGTRADCKEVVRQIRELRGKNLLADCGYDTSEIISYAESVGMNVVIPPRKNRKE